MKWYKCKKCDAKFTTPQGVAAHQRVHNIEKAVKKVVAKRKYKKRKKGKRALGATPEAACPICGKEFIHRGNLNRHLASGKNCKVKYKGRTQPATTDDTDMLRAGIPPERTAEQKANDALINVIHQLVEGYRI